MFLPYFRHIRYNGNSHSHLQISVNAVLCDFINCSLMSGAEDLSYSTTALFYLTLLFSTLFYKTQSAYFLQLYNGLFSN